MPNKKFLEIQENNPDFWFNEKKKIEYFCYIMGHDRFNPIGIFGSAKEDKSQEGTRETFV